MWLYRSFGVFILLDCLLRITSISVRFPLKDTHYVALNETLFLDARIDKGPTEEVTLQTWDIKNVHGEVRLITDTKATNSRVSVGNGGTRLIVAPVTEADYGSYTFTVTDKHGVQKSDSVRVAKPDKPLKASLVLKCSVSREGAPWDTPKYSWQVDGEKINKTQLSEDGSALYLSEELGRSYACAVESAQGASETRIRTKGPDPDTQGNCSTTIGVLIALVVIEAAVIVIGVLMYLKWCRPGNRGVV